VGNEARWSDLLAVLIATDPVPLAETLGLRHDPSALAVHREVALDTENRPDMILTAGEDRVAVIEVKVLADLGTGQLARYEAAEPGADVYALLYSGRLVIDLAGARRLRGLTWESVLTAYASSGHPWVAGTARAWLGHVEAALPEVGPDTVGNDLRPGEDFVIAVGADNLCHQVIFMNHASGAVAPKDAETVQVCDAIWQRAQRRGLAQGAVRPVSVVEVLVLAQHGHQVPLVPDQGPV
jgi:hypothetical protein